MLSAVPRASLSFGRRAMSSSAPGAYSSLFASQSDLYKLYRPTYPGELFESILRFHKEKGSGQLNLAVDIAAGSGQATKALGKHFAAVIGVDESESQISQSKTTENVEYRLGSAEHCPCVGTSTADVVTVAQAAHWFDLPKFYAEASRMLKPKGTLAMWCYSTGAPVVPAGDMPPSAATAVNAELQAAFLHCYSDVLGPYWDAKRQLVDDEYAGLEPSKLAPGLFENEERARSLMSLRMPLPSLASYVQTWSAHATYLKKHPEVKRGSEEDPAMRMLQRMAEVLGVGSESKEIIMEWPVAMILATKKA